MLKLKVTDEWIRVKASGGMERIMKDLSDAICALTEGLMNELDSEHKDAIVSELVRAGCNAGIRKALERQRMEGSEC